MRWGLVCEVALHEKNGAGIRALIPYLKLLPADTLDSIYLRLAHFDEKCSLQARLIQIPFVRWRGLENLSIFFGTLFKIKRFYGKDARDTHFLVLPNSIQDILMGIACRLLSPKVTVWVMDDFLQIYENAPRWVRKIYRACFALLYRWASQRIVVSPPLDHQYQVSFNVPADHILGRSLPELLAPISNKNPLSLPLAERTLRLVYIGSFNHYYEEPLFILKRLLETQSVPINLTVDLFGIAPPSSEWVLPNKIVYRGPIESTDPTQVLKILSQYDFGIAPYSSYPDAQKMMRFSFPSKLIDYVGASLPVWVIAPSSLHFLDSVQQKRIGIIQTDFSISSFMQTLQQLTELKSVEYQQWQNSAHQWAKEDFLLNPNQVKQILDV